GGTHPIPVDVRVITGSKRSVQHLAEEGRFREDLYYRLNVVPIWIPPLRERREDIAPLTEHFLRRFFGERGMAVADLSPVVKATFERHDWPGNVRELESASEGVAPCASSRARASGSRIPARARRCGSAACRRRCCFIRATSRRRRRR